jgi:hypothetical protein
VPVCHVRNVELPLETSTRCNQGQYAQWLRTDIPARPRPHPTGPEAPHR